MEITKEEIEAFKKDCIVRGLKLPELCTDEWCIRQIEELYKEIDNSFNKEDCKSEEINSLEEREILFKGSNFTVFKDGFIAGEPNLRGALYEVALEYSKQKLELEQQIKDFLTEWSSCSNRCTAFPYYWTIADERETFNSCKTGEYVYDSQNAEIRNIKDILEEMNESGDIDLPDELTFEELVDSIGGICEEDLVEELLKKYTGEIYLKRFEQEWETYYEGIFFTEEDAKEYLESCKNHHFGPKPRTYLECFNKWGRHSRTEEFLKNIFEYFEVPLPPELYYKEEKEENNET